ncbi:MAG TPA: hypothetical protein VGF80_14885 [Galbitalea sp.]|jgi:hypothetical protein
MAEQGPEKPIGTSPRVRDQPSLTTSSGKSWLILGGLLALIAIAVMIPLLAQKPAGLALFGICATVALYAAMIVVRVNTRPGKAMLGWLAALMIAIALVGVVCVGLIAAGSGNIVDL